MQNPADKHHTPHTPGDEGSSRMWLYGGIALLVIALIYSVGIFMRSRSNAGSTSVSDMAPVNFDPANDQFGVAIGPADAKVVVREFADYQCPACGGFEPVLAQMRKDYVDTGKVRFVFFDFPLDIHKNALVAAQVARCAGEQNHYWEMHDYLYAHQAEWGDLADPADKFVSYAGATGVEGSKLMSCIRTGATRQAVLRSQDFGNAYGLTATPTFAVNGKAHAGGISYADLKTLIDQQLAAPAAH